MIICEFCQQLAPDVTCRLGLKLPKGMSCHEFTPGLEGFCANPSDFVNPNQLIGMATHFGIKGSELKKVKLMAKREETARL